MKKILLIKLSIVFLIFGLIGFILITIIAIVGYSTGSEYQKQLLSEMRENSTVINNQIYADRYRKLLNNHLKKDGYVTLERIVYYLQRTNNILDTSKLSYEKWEKAYLKNVDSEKKQMIPIKTICKDLKKDNTLPEYTIKSGKNEDGVEIDKIDLCYINDKSVADSNDYTDVFLELPFSFPLKKSQDFTVTSIVFESRELDFTSDGTKTVDQHSGWDFAVPVGTNVYSICDGTVTSIINTQDNDLNYYESYNKVGNYIIVACDNGLSANYFHLKYKSTPDTIKVGTHIKKGEKIAKTSTTGTSTGPHLHLGLKDANSTNLDALAYINLFNWEE